jgi:hypothetical protein
MIKQLGGRVYSGARDICGLADKGMRVIHNKYDST